MTTNPYQSPSETDEIFADILPESCWRDKKQLVVTDRTMLPRRCPKCNRMATRTIRRKLRVPMAISPLRILGFTAVMVLAILIPFVLSRPKLSVGLPIGLAIGICVVSLFWVFGRRREQTRIGDRFPNTVYVEFSICNRHRLAEWFRLLISLTPIFFIFGKTFLELGGGTRFSFGMLYFPWIIIMLFSSRLSFHPMVKRRIGGRYWIDGCDESFLEQLPSFRETLGQDPNSYDAPRSVISEPSVHTELGARRDTT